MSAREVPLKAKIFGDLSISGNVKRAEQKYALTEAEFVKYSEDHMDFQGVAKYKVNSPYIKNLKHTRKPPYYRAAKHPAHDYLETHVRNNLFNPGPIYKPKEVQYFQKLPEKIKPGERQPQRETWTVKQMKYRTNQAGPAEYKPEVAYNKLNRI